MERLSFFQRSGYHWPCVALATILANDIRAEENDHHPLSLRDEASENGLTYLQVVRYLPHTDLYVARVACDPEALGTSDLLAFFTEAQLTYALPWDVRLQSKCSGEIRTAIDAHAASLRPARARQVHQEGSQQVCPMLPLNPFPEAVEVSREALHDALQATVAEQQGETRQVGVSPTQATQTLQQALLLAALDQLMARLWHTPNQARSLLAQARCKVLARLRTWQQYTHQRVVTAAPFWHAAKGCVLWRLTIGIPVALL